MADTNVYLLLLYIPNHISFFLLNEFCGAIQILRPLFKVYSATVIALPLQMYDHTHYFFITQLRCLEVNDFSESYC